jgi:hypothetical protein
MARRKMLRKKKMKANGGLETFSDLKSLLLVFFILFLRLGRRICQSFGLLSTSRAQPLAVVCLSSSAVWAWGMGSDASGMEEPGTNVINFGSLPSRKYDI